LQPGKSHAALPVPVPGSPELIFLGHNSTVKELIDEASQGSGEVAGWRIQYPEELKSGKEPPPTT